MALVPVGWPLNRLQWWRARGMQTWSLALIVSLTRTARWDYRLSIGQGSPSNRLVVSFKSNDLGFVIISVFWPPTSRFEGSESVATWRWCKNRPSQGSQQQMRTTYMPIRPARTVCLSVCICKSLRMFVVAEWKEERRSSGEKSGRQKLEGGA